MWHQRNLSAACRGSREGSDDAQNAKAIQKKNLQWIVKTEQGACKGSRVESSGTSASRTHQDHFSHSAVKQNLLVHAPMPVGKALQIPVAASAINAECAAVEKKLKSCDPNAPRVNAEVVQEAEKREGQVHFATFDWCFYQNNSQLPESMRKCK